MSDYSINLGRALSQLGNAVLAGDPDETISSRAFKNRGRRNLFGLIDWAITLVFPNHTKNALERDEGDPYP
ncbi:MAG: hypothetical protein AAGE89_12585 [Pseudomonadota bacterium]